jgi:hypothetical protein
MPLFQLRYGELKGGVFQIGAKASVSMILTSEEGVGVWLMDPPNVVEFVVHLGSSP